MHNRAAGEKSPEFLNHSAATRVLRIDFLALVAFIFQNHTSEKKFFFSLFSFQSTHLYRVLFLVVCVHIGIFAENAKKFRSTISAAHLNQIHVPSFSSRTLPGLNYFDICKYTFFQFS